MDELLHRKVAESLVVLCMYTHIHILVVDNSHFGNNILMLGSI
jgi:hypothetical protein